MELVLSDADGGWSTGFGSCDPGDVPDLIRTLIGAELELKGGNIVPVTGWRLFENGDGVAVEFIPG